jgi:hypothetical protein
MDKVGLATVEEGMRCNLPLGAAKQKATVTIYDTFFRDPEGCKEKMLDLIKQQVTFRVLVIHPYSVTVDMRASQTEDFDLKSYRNHITDMLRVLKSIAQTVQSDGAFQVKIYDDLPGIPIYAVDNPNDDERVLYQGYYLQKGASDLPAFAFHSKHGGARLYDALHAYVNDRWDKAKLLNIKACDDDLEKCVVSQIPCGAFERRQQDVSYTANWCFPAIPR